MTQKQALEIIKMGNNVFLTGPAGSGKTYVLNEYIRYLQSKEVAVGITASTGIAATHIGGITIHSWAGIGIKDTLHEGDFSELSKKYYLRKRFARTKVLIIDEVSMLHAHRLDLVNYVCQKLKGNSLPFGGLQVILCGDFFQLPPVERKIKTEERTMKIDFERNDSEDRKLQGNDSLSFVYNSESWKQMNLKICYLEEQYRQDDRVFLRILNDIRNGEVDEMTFEYLSERLDKEVEGYAKPTKLFTHNADVDAINAKHLSQLPGDIHEYYMTRNGSLPLTEILKNSCLAPEKLLLKIGAQVMFVKNNYDAGYVNGTLGEVIDFDPDGFPKVRTFDGMELVVNPVSWEVKDPTSPEAMKGEGGVIASIAQLPLRLAWAITIHKSQGMSLDAAEIDLSRSFLPGMGYVALSRVRNLSGLKLMGMNQVALQVHPDVAAMDKRLQEQSHEAEVYLQGLQKETKEQFQNHFLKYLLEK